MLICPCILILRLDHTRWWRWSLRSEIESYIHWIVWFQRFDCGTRPSEPSGCDSCWRPCAWSGRRIGCRPDPRATWTDSMPGPCSAGPASAHYRPRPRSRWCRTRLVLASSSRVGRARRRSWNRAQGCGHPQPWWRFCQSQSVHRRVHIHCIPPSRTQSDSIPRRKRHLASSRAWRPCQSRRSSAGSTNSSKFAIYWLQSTQRKRTGIASRVSVLGGRGRRPEYSLWALEADSEGPFWTSVRAGAASLAPNSPVSEASTAPLVDFVVVNDDEIQSALSSFDRISIAWRPTLCLPPRYGLSGRRAGSLWAHLCPACRLYQRRSQEQLSAMPNFCCIRYWLRWQPSDAPVPVCAFSSSLWAPGLQALLFSLGPKPASWSHLDVYSASNLSLQFINSAYHFEFCAFFKSLLHFQVLNRHWSSTRSLHGCIKLGI